MVSRKLIKSSLLRKGSDFDRAYDSGTRLYGQGFTLICRASLAKKSRLGISIHRKIRGAVNRNRIKRIIRESFRLEHNRYPASADIVFVVRPVFSYTHPADITDAVAELAAGYSSLQAA